MPSRFMHPSSSSDCRRPYRGTMRSTRQIHWDMTELLLIHNLTPSECAKAIMFLTMATRREIDMYKKVVAAVTTAAGTSEVIDIRDYVTGSVHNESGGAIVVTYYGKHHKDGVALALMSSAVTTPVAYAHSVGDDECVMLPDLTGVAFLIPVGNGAGELTYYFQS